MITTVHARTTAGRPYPNAESYLLQEAGSKVLQENLSGILLDEARLAQDASAVMPLSVVHTAKLPALHASPIKLDMLQENLSFLLQEDGASKILIEREASGQMVRVR